MFGVVREPVQLHGALLLLDKVVGPGVRLEEERQVLGVARVPLGRAFEHLNLLLGGTDVLVEEREGVEDGIVGGSLGSDLFAEIHALVLPAHAR